MAGPLPDSSGGDTGAGPGREPPTGLPRWVKIFGVIAAVVILLIVIVLLTSGPGGHGPGRHGLGQTPASSVAKRVV